LLKGRHGLACLISAGRFVAIEMTFRPDAALARVLTEGIRQRLATSLMALARACRGIVPVDEDALRCQLAVLSGALAVRPGVYLLYYQCLAAVQRDDPDALAALLHRMNAISVAAPRFLVRNFRDGSLVAEEWDWYERALMTAPDTPLALGSVPASLFAAASDLLAAARQVLATAAPALAGEISILINEVVFAEDTTGVGSSFGGATSFHAWGALFLNARRHSSLVSMADGLVHEAAHAMLFALASGEAMVENDSAERFASPLRSDRRPMEGVFHATFVSARVCYSMAHLAAADTLDLAHRQEAARARDRARRAFDAGYALVKAHARPTAIGRQAMDGAVGYMDRNGG
jgi:hypothetical protein